MKKFLIILLSLLVCAGIAGAVSFAQAVAGPTFVFSPAAKTVEAGQSFNLDIAAKLGGVEVDTARAFVHFPPDLLEVENFALGNLFSNAAPGNILDNQNGYLSQGGFRKNGGTSEDGIFGTITFKAKKAGQAKIQFTDGSRLISVGQEKIDLSGVGKAEIEIKEAAASVFAPEPETAKTEIAAAEGQESFLEIRSSSHPNQNNWRSNNEVAVNWTISGNPLKNLSDYFYAWNQEPDFLPTTNIGKAVEKVFADAPDGVWYFHLRAKFTDGSFSEAVHFRIMIDTAAPGPIVPVVDQNEIEKGQTTYLRFATTDQTSGVAYYEVGVEDVFAPAQSPYLLNDLKIGNYTLIVKAFDKAGNSSSGQTELKVVSGPWWKNFTVWTVIVIVVLLAAALQRIVRKKRGAAV